MILRMYLDEVLIDEMPIISTVNLGEKKEQLMDDNKGLIESYQGEPKFYVEGIPSRMNY